VASLSPILIVGPVADLVGREPVIFVVGIIVSLWGVASVASRRPGDLARAPSTPSGAPVDPMTAAMSPNDFSGQSASDGSGTSSGAEAGDGLPS
jgi:hypothetical protein